MSKIVFSDIEGTLVKGSLPGMFVRCGYRLGVFNKGTLGLALLLNTLAKPFPTYSRPNNYLRYAALRLLIRGRTVEEVGRVVDATVPQLLEALKPASAERLRRHQADQTPIVLISSALQEAVTRLAVEFGGRGEGTQMVIRNGKFTGGGSTPCQGQEKVRRVQAIATELGIDLAEATGYGDTLADLDFLSIVGHPVAVDPDPVLKDEAIQRGWEILLTSESGS